MNNQIEDLMYRAGLTAQGCWDKMDEYDKQALNKFAELIVRECAEYAEHKLDMAGYKKKFMLKHFGVEK